MNKPMEIKKLSILQIIFVYYHNMKKDFPADEIKPLLLIILPVLKKKYFAIGLIDGHSIRAYAMLIKQDKNYLLDYLAVDERFRSRGLGSEILKSMKKYTSDAASLLVEIEDIESATDDKERRCRERRREFYVRAGFQDTRVRSKLFGVDFAILEKSEYGRHTEAEIENIYFDVYRTTLSETGIKKYINIRRKD